MAEHSVIKCLRNERNPKLEWPDFYPVNCPPAGADPASGVVYRLVRRDPVQAEDFKTPWEEYPRRFKEPTITNCGVSVHTDLQDSKKLKDRIPKFRNRQTAEGELNPTLGIIQHTPSIERSHHAWWIPVGAEPWIVFNVIGS